MIGDYLGSNPFELVEGEDSSTGDLVTRIHVARQPSVDLSAVIGDVVHNARSALNQLAWHLVERDGGSPDKYTYFPTGETKSKFGKSVKEALRGASSETRDRVRSMEVHPGGDDKLWLLHQLDIEDKHRLLIPMGMTYGALNLHATFQGFGAGPLEVPPIAINPADKMYPLREVMRYFALQRQHARRTTARSK